jgi:hypothetical protein
VSKVWWDGEKLMAIPIPLEDFYQPAPVQEPVAWGWAIMHSDGTKASVRPRIVDFFGCIQEKEPFTSEDAKRADQEWAGLAPHTIVTLYTTPPAQPAPVPLTDEQKVLRSLLGAALGALRYHTEQTRPIQRTNETITAIEHELAAHGIK